MSAVDGPGEEMPPPLSIFDESAHDAAAIDPAAAYRPDGPYAPAVIYTPADPRRVPRPRKPAKPKVVEQPSGRAAATRRRAVTAASRRVGGDSPVWFVLQVIGLLVVIAAGLTVSATALVVAGGWQQTPELLDPVTILQVDAPMLVAYLMTITFKWRGYPGWLWAARIFGGVMTAFSAVLNFAYTVTAAATVNESTGFSSAEEVIGALLHGSAPVLVFVCFEFFGQVVTRPQKNARRLEKLTVKELERVKREIERRSRAAAAAEAKALRG